MNITPEQLQNFERAFTSGTSSIRTTCECGIEYYDYTARVGWDDGELEELQDDPKTRGLDFSVGGVHINGKDYVAACSCWHGRAENIIQFITDNRREIGEFFKLEVESLKAKADTYPKL